MDERRVEKKVPIFWWVGKVPIMMMSLPNCPLDLDLDSCSHNEILLASKLVLTSSSFTLNFTLDLDFGVRNIVFKFCFVSKFGSTKS